MENVKRLMSALQLLETIPCVGKENMTRMLIAMQHISEVATSMTEKTAPDKEKED